MPGTAGTHIQRANFRLITLITLVLILLPAIVLADFPPAEQQTQLAGNSLAQYPWFEYVKAFNEDATVSLAIDPYLFPSIAGQTADIYIVDSKTTSQWTSDPSLTDVAGGPQAVTFNALSIQSNTVTVANPLTLDSDAGTSIGVGYDVVVDMDRDGTLSETDFIDGLGEESGFYVMHDLTLPGPLAVTEILYSGGSWLGQDLYYPTNIASMGLLPLVVISHGNGHYYQWYDHIGTHLASYGFIVMSHENNTSPGIETASTTTLTNTDYIIGNQATIGGGVLNGHIDSHAITWIGHSRGGEGITRAYDRLYDGAYTPSDYIIEDVILLSSMLPTDFLKTSSSNPHDVNYHLWTAAGDSDVNGSASCDLCQTYHLHDRATGFRQSTTVQGTGHGWFHDGGGSSYFTGPCSIGEENTHLIQKGYFLPLVKHYVQGNVPARDYLWRQYERFHPIGVDTSNLCIVVSNEYRNGGSSGNFMIDDFQTQSSSGTSSSGGSVSFTVENLTEGRLDDNTTTFSWSASDPFNGATQASSEGSDDSSGVVFDWTDNNRYIEWEIVSGERDLSDDLYLSFRGAQGTQHPNTLAVRGDLTFSVTLRDGSGVTGSINIGAYGGGLEQPYDRDGGWHNEMEVIRIRLTDFLHNNTGLDLTDVVAVRFDCGPSWGSSEGRIVVDELMITNDAAPPIPGSISIILPDGVPSLIAPGVSTDITVQIAAVNESYIPGSGTLHYRFDGGTWLTAPLSALGGELFEATLPGPSCSDTPEFYFSAQGDVSGVVHHPATAPVDVHTAMVGTLTTVIQDDFNTDLGWSVEDEVSLTSGTWERGVPVGGGDRGDPAADYDGSGSCYLTQNVDGDSDVDGGRTWLLTPSMDLSGGSDALVEYALWYTNNNGSDPDNDLFLVHVSNDDGGNWTLVETIGPQSLSGWNVFSFLAGDFIALTGQMKFRFEASDLNSGSVVEAGLDAVSVSLFDCQTTSETISADLTCAPPSGTVPFATQMTVTLDNLYTGQTRRIAARVNARIANGTNYNNWKSGWTNVNAGGSFVSTWSQTIPALGSVVGDNIFTLEAEDVTPAPYNQPPEPPAGDTDTSFCTVTGVAP